MRGAGRRRSTGKKKEDTGASDNEEGDDGMNENIREAGVGPSQAGVWMKECARRSGESGGAARVEVARVEGKAGLRQEEWKQKGGECEA